MSYTIDSTPKTFSQAEITATFDWQGGDSIGDEQTITATLHNPNPTSVSGHLLIQMIDLADDSVVITLEDSDRGISGGGDAPFRHTWTPDRAGTFLCRVTWTPA